MTKVSTVRRHYCTTTHSRKILVLAHIMFQLADFSDDLFAFFDFLQDILIRTVISGGNFVDLV
jgi:hypothetical protein